MRPSTHSHYVTVCTEKDLQALRHCSELILQRKTFATFSSYVLRLVSPEIPLIYRVS